MYWCSQIWLILIKLKITYTLFASTVPQVSPKCAPAVPQLYLPRLCPKCAQVNFCPNCSPSMPQVCPNCAPVISILCLNCAQLDNQLADFDYLEN